MNTTRVLYCLSLIALLMPAGCSDVRLAKMAAQTGLQSKIPDGSFCSRPADLTASQLKVVFVVDMSLSNIGEFKDLGNGKVTFSGGSATDPNGVRFDKIKEFISSCGSTNASNRFKIVGFSGGAIKANPALSGCQGGFLDRDQALGAVDSLKSLQDYNKANINFSDFAPSMQTTMYQDGLECAKSVVLDDMQQFPVDAKNANYMTFFVTDGKATDNCRENSAEGQFRDQYGACCPGGAIRQQGGTCCAPGVIATWIFSMTGSQYCCAVGDRRSDIGRCEPDPNYTDALKAATNPHYESIIKDMMLAGRSKASTIRLQPIYYGPQNESKDALDLLDSFAGWGDSAKTIQLNNVNQADFCKYANSAVKTQFQVSEFNVVNLTATMKNGVLVADSDVDGVPDADDPHPSDSHSNSAGLLDGICHSASGDFNCDKPNRCDTAKVTSTHLTECDLAALSLADGDGIDYDKDRIPDLVEILRGTLPNINDAYSNLDGDSMSNIDEIRIGREVDFPDDKAPSSILMNWSISRIGADELCPSNQQNYKISLSRVPVVQTKAYSDRFDGLKPGSKFNLSHGVDENVIFIYYMSEPLNNKGVPAEFYGTVVKVRYGSNVEGDIKVDPKSFKKLGSLSGKPQW